MRIKGINKNRYSGWDEKYEPGEFRGTSNRRDSLNSASNSLLLSAGDLSVDWTDDGDGDGDNSIQYKTSKGILHKSKYGASTPKSRRVTFFDPRQERIEEEIDYHAREMKHLAKALEAVAFGQSDDGSSTIVSHDSFSVEAEYANNPKESSRPSKWRNRSKSPLRRGRNKSPMRSRGRSKSPCRGALSHHHRSRSPHRDKSRPASPRRRTQESHYFDC